MANSVRFPSQFAAAVSNEQVTFLGDGTRSSCVFGMNLPNVPAILPLQSRDARTALAARSPCDQTSACMTRLKKIEQHVQHLKLVFKDRIRLGPEIAINGMTR